MIFHFIKRHGMWCLFLAIVIIEFFFFRHFVIKEVADFYPEGFDQASFLIQVYQTYSSIQKLGLVQGLEQTSGLATGPLFILQAILFLWLFGASRFTLLFINFIYFVGLQFFTLVAVRSFTKQNRAVFCIWGLILGLHTLSNQIGGIVDFRMDFIAFSLYGIITACLIKSRAFFRL